MAIDSSFAATTIVPASNNSAGITAAIAAAASKGLSVSLLAATYTIDAPINLVSGVSIVGTNPILLLSGNITDQGFSTAGGTIFAIAPGITALNWNNVDKYADEVNISTFAVTNIEIKNIVFVGGARAINVGAMYAMGPTYSKFYNLYGINQTADFAFDFKNFQHCEIGNIYTSTNLTTGSGIRFASQLSATLIPGNSVLTGDIYTYCSNRLNRSVVIEASGPSGCVLNQIKVTGRLQGNRYGLASPDTIAATTTNASSLISVPSAAAFALGVPVIFSGTAPGGFSLYVVYFVKAIDTTANTITLVENPYDTSAIVATSSATYNIKHSGFPSVEIKAPLSTNSIQNSDFGQIDAEAYGNVCAVLVAQTRQCRMFLAEIMASSTNTALVTRGAMITVCGPFSNTLTQDISYNWGYMILDGGSQPYGYSGGSFTLDASWHGRSVQYTGTADIAITIPNYLPKGFQFSITTTGATGIITFSGPTSGATRSKSGFRTNGQNSTVFLTNIANMNYRLTGDTQV